MAHADTICAALGCSPKTAGRIAAAAPPWSLRSLTASQVRSLGATERQAQRWAAIASLVTAMSARDQGTSMRRPGDIARAMRRRFDMGALEQEHFWVIALNARMQVLDVITVGLGSLAHVDVHPREVFTPLVRMRAHSCIIAHNHPSGDASPSDADVRLTHRLCEAGKLMGVPVLDHFIFAAESHVSMAELGIFPA